MFNSRILQKMPNEYIHLDICMASVPFTTTNVHVCLICLITYMYIYISCVKYYFYPLLTCIAGGITKLL